MARPREFDVDDALSRALSVFWSNGFDGCSIQELLDEMQISRQSLYNTFGDKNGLFLQVLKLYQSRLDLELAPLRERDADFETFYDFAKNAIEAQQQLGAGACLMVMTAFSPKLNDSKLADVVVSGSQHLRDCLTDFVANLQSRENLSNSFDSKSVANYLYTLLNGSSALARTGVECQDVLSSLQLALNTLTTGELAI